MSTPRSATEAPGIAVQEGRPSGTWRGLEFWGWSAYAVTAALVMLIAILELRPGGLWPIYAFSIGRPVLEMAVLFLLLVALLWSALHRPFVQRRRVVPALCLLGVLGVMSYPFPYPSSHEDHPSALCFRLPVDGEWTVVWGGDTSDENRNAGLFADRRWGMDLVVTENGTSHRGEGLAATDYFAYGREVLAPADGRVVRVLSGIEDSLPGSYDSRVERFGNHVVLDVGESQYVFLCHLMTGSITVEAGRTVHRGDLLGRVGNSGFSTITPEPHLSLHLQDSPDARKGEAVPWSFCNYVVDGRTIDRGVPRGGVRADGAFRGEIVQAASDTGR